jgi:hypothetical protein
VEWREDLPRGITIRSDVAQGSASLQRLFLRLLRVCHQVRPPSPHHPRTFYSLNTGKALALTSWEHLLSHHLFRFRHPFCFIHTYVLIPLR